MTEGTKTQIRILLKNFSNVPPETVEEFFHVLQPSGHPLSAPGRHVPVREAARILSVTPGYVHVLLSRGILRRYVAPGKTYASGVDLESLAEFVNGKGGSR